MQRGFEFGETLNHKDEDLRLLKVTFGLLEDTAFNKVEPLTLKNTIENLKKIKRKIKLLVVRVSVVFKFLFLIVMSAIITRNKVIKKSIWVTDSNQYLTEIERDYLGKYLECEDVFTIRFFIRKGRWKA